MSDIKIYNNGQLIGVAQSVSTTQPIGTTQSVSTTQPISTGAYYSGNIRIGTDLNNIVDNYQPALTVLKNTINELKNQVNDLMSFLEYKGIVLDNEYKEFIDSRKLITKMSISANASPDTLSTNPSK